MAKNKNKKKLGDFHEQDSYPDQTEYLAAKRASEAKAEAKSKKKKGKK